MKSKNFIFIVIGQIISLFGNGIVRFALPLYLLQETKSPVIFGIVSAVSLVPFIILMPIGGIIADRINKKYIMVILDFLASLLMFLFLIFINKVSIVALVSITMIFLYSINGLYQPAVQSSIPFVLHKDDFMKGNAIISGISSLANFLSPMIGGFLFGNFSIISIITISMICFFLSAILELFINMNDQKVLEKQSIKNMLQQDIKSSVNFIFKEKIVLSKLVFITCILNAFISSLMMIGLPILITENLMFPAEMYGVATGILALGGLLGGVVINVLKWKIEKLYALFLMLMIALILLFVAPFVQEIKVLSYLLIVMSSFFVMNIATILSIMIITYIQAHVPKEITGKVIAFLLTLSICSQPLGQLVYSFAFEYGKGYESCIIFIAIMVTFFTAVYTKYHLPKFLTR